MPNYDEISSRWYVDFIGSFETVEAWAEAHGWRAWAFQATDLGIGREQWGAYRVDRETSVAVASSRAKGLSGFLSRIVRAKAVPDGASVAARLCCHHLAPWHDPPDDPGNAGRIISAWAARDGYRLYRVNTSLDARRVVRTKPQAVKHAEGEAHRLMATVKRLRDEHHARA